MHIQNNNSLFAFTGIPETPEEAEKKAYQEKHYRFIEEIKTLLTLTNCIPFKVKTTRCYCAYCYLDSPWFEDLTQLKTHMREHHEEDRISAIESILRPIWMYEVLRIDIQDLECQSCYTRIGGWNEMFIHFHEIHGVNFDLAYTKLIPYKLDNDLHCALCNEKFENFQHLDTHMNAHYNNYVCAECGDTFVSETRMKKHMMIHETGRFPCEECGKVFPLKKYMTKHYLMVHEQKKMFKCLYCPERFSSEYIKHNHVLEKHQEKVRVITCEICGKVFNWRPYYLAHVRKTHSKVLKYNCDYCAKSFATRHECKSHIMRHTGEGKKHECSVCQKRFITAQELKSHSKVHLKKVAVSES